MNQAEFQDQQRNVIANQGSATYQGHLADGSSVQKHSAGPLYPFVIYARQRDDALVYGVLTPKGNEVDVGNYNSAVRLALILKAAKQ